MRPESLRLSQALQSNCSGEFEFQQCFIFLPEAVLTRGPGLIAATNIVAGPPLIPGSFV